MSIVRWNLKKETDACSKFTCRIAVHRQISALRRQSILKMAVSTMCVDRAIFVARIDHFAPLFLLL